MSSTEGVQLSAELPLASAAFPAERGEPNEWLLRWKRLSRHRLALLGLVLLVVLSSMSLLAPLLTPYDFAETNLRERLSAPSWVHWMGTDALGRDMFARILHGGRVSLAVGILVALSTVVIGGLIGAASAYAGGWVDNLVMRIIDVALSLPTLAILLALSKIFGQGFWTIIIILVALMWMQIARIVRGVTLSLKEQDFILAARAVGSSGPRVVVRHLLPNAMAPMIVAATLGAGNAIRLEAFLSFLGMGIRPPMPSWGNLMTGAQEYLLLAPWLTVFPGLFIFLTLLSLNFLGDGLRDALDPRFRR